MRQLLEHATPREGAAEIGVEKVRTVENVNMRTVSRTLELNSNIMAIKYSIPQHRTCSTKSFAGLGFG